MFGAPIPCSSVPPNAILILNVWSYVVKPVSTKKKDHTTADDRVVKRKMNDTRTMLKYYGVSAASASHNEMRIFTALSAQRDFFNRRWRCSKCICTIGTPGRRSDIPDPQTTLHRVLPENYRRSALSRYGPSYPRAMQGYPRAGLALEKKVLPDLASLVFKTLKIFPCLYRNNNYKCNEVFICR